MSKIRIRHGDDEIDVEGTDAFISDQLASFYKRIEKIGATKLEGDDKGGKSDDDVKQKHSTKKQTPAEYYRAKGKTDGISQLLIFGKYLEEYEGINEFERSDINRVMLEAKLPKDIHTQYFTNAVKDGFLRKKGKKYSLTISAEKALSAM